MLGRVATAIGDAGGSIGAVDLIGQEGGHTFRDKAVQYAIKHNTEAKRQGTTSARDEIGYTRGETTEFRAIRAAHRKQSCGSRSPGRGLIGSKSTPR